MKTIAAAAFIALASLGAVPASAATVLNLGPGTSSTHFGDTSYKKGTLADLFTFTLAKKGTVNGFLGSIALKKSLDVVITSVILDHKLFTRISSGTVDLLTLDDTKLSAGVHTLAVNGKWGSAGGSYSGTLNYLITAVPEPETWALMIGGFGLIGGTMRRRKASPAPALA